MFTPILRVLGVTLLSSLTATLWAANPKTSNPNHNDSTTAMAVHGDEPCIQLSTDCQERFEKAEKIVREIMDKDQKRQLEKVKPQQFTEANLALNQIRRLATQLRIWGEPAGYDFNLRADTRQDVLVRLAAPYSSVPAAQTFIQQGRAFIQKNQKARDNELRRIDELMSKGEWATAETAIYALYDKYDAAAFFLSTDEKRSVYDPFGTRRITIEAQMAAIRHKAAAQTLNVRRKSQVANFDQILQELGTAVNSVKATGSASVNNQMLSGPELFQHFGTQWQQALAGMLRYRGLAWAIGSQDAGNAAPILNPNSADAVDPVIGQYLKFGADISAGLTGLIEADAGRAPEAEVPALYGAYLQAAAPLAGRAWEAEPTLNPWGDRLQAALLKLASRAPTHSTAAVAYQEATGDLLDWRRRAAAATAKSQASTFEPVEKRFQKEAKQDAMFRGLILLMSGDPTLPALLGPSPDIVPTLFSKLSGKQVAVRYVSGLAGGKSQISRYSEGTYASVRALAAACAPATAALRSDLLVSDELPPLSLAASMALANAERGDALMLGGSISGLHLEGLITRYATLPDAAWPLSTVTFLPRPTKIDTQLIANVVVRIELEPRWVQNEYFFVNLGAAAVASN